MEKQKIMGLGLAALLFVGAACVPVGKTAFADETNGGENTEITTPSSGEGEGGEGTPPTTGEGENPANGAVSLTVENTDLFLPTSYEQYLPLDNPSCMALSDHYIAVADGTFLYIYDKAQGEYSCYDAMMLTNTSAISNIQISEDERLYFSAGIRLFSYDFETGTGDIINNVSCNTFLVEGEYLYTSYITANSEVSLKRYPLSDISLQTEMEITTVSKASTYSKLATWNGILYCVRNDRTISSYDISKMSPGVSGLISALVPLDSDIDRIEKISDIQRVCAYDGYLYYSVSGDGAYPNGLWRTDFNGNAERLLEGNGYSAITTYRGDLYCMRNTSVLRLAVTEDGLNFTGYEIAASSYSENRLMDAADAVRAGNLLIVADYGASRVSVYDQAKHSYTVIECEFKPTYVATDGETIAVASGKSVYTCKNGDTELGEPKATLQADVKGIAVIYGSVYYVTENSVYGKVGETRTAVHSYKTPLRLTSDIYGNLFMSNTDGEVYTFTEESFLTANTGAKLDITFPKNHTSLRADFEGNLYCLSDNKIYKNGMEVFAEFSGAENEFVYNANKTAKTASTFALGFEDSEVYFYFGNYALKSQNGVLSIPTLDRISTDGVISEMFSVHGEDDLLVKIPERTIGIVIDLPLFRDVFDGTAEDVTDEYFPYVSYFRMTEEESGILLGETQRYYVVLFYQENTNDYKTALFQKSRDYLVDKDSYWQAYSEEENGQYYLSHDARFYFAPCLDGALWESAHNRGTALSVVGYVTAPDLEYAIVSYVDENSDNDDARILKTGFVPRSFLTETSPVPDAEEEYFPVVIKEGEAIVFTAHDGSTITVDSRTEARAVENGDGTYTVSVIKDGNTYYAVVKGDRLEVRSSDALRIALIIIFSVLALVIIGAYVFLLPKRKREKAKKEQSEKKKASKASEKKE